MMGPIATITIDSSSDEEEENKSKIDALKQAAESERAEKRLDTLFAKTGESPKVPVFKKHTLNVQSQSTSHGSPRKLAPVKVKSSTKKEKKRIAPTLVNSQRPHQPNPATTSTHHAKASAVQQKAPSTPRNERDADDLDEFEEALLRDDEPVTPSASLSPLDYYEAHCWTCRCRLKETHDKRACLYDMHVHPFLNVPICAVCVEDVQDVVGNSLCSGCCCTEEEDLHLLCDACDRAFCFKCVARAYASEPAAQRLVADTTSTWNCLQCEAPPALKAIQIADARDDQPSDEEEASEKRINECLERLNAIEDELRACAIQERGQEQRKKRFRSELKKQGLEGRSLDERAEQEFLVHDQQWDKHHRRLEDSRSVCQDNLESMGVSLMMYYKQRKILFPDETAAVPTDGEPDWKVAADAEIDRREQERLRTDVRAHTAHTDADSSDEDFDDPSDVEDLGDDAEDDREINEDVRRWRDQWRNSRADRGVVERKLQKYMKRERERKQRIRRRVSARSDIDEVEREKRVTSVKGRGVTVRRDTIVHLKRRRASASNHAAAGGRRGAAAARAPRPERPFSEKVTPQQVHTSVPLGMFDNSSLVLSETSARGPPIAVAKPLAAKLMPHQVEGVSFMWNRTFSHLAVAKTRQEAAKSPGGVILAHFMGLGKTIQTIALLHMLINHPALVDEASSLRMIHKVLLIVPANTIANWCAEFRKWTENLFPGVSVFDLSSTHTSYRNSVVADWGRQGGVLLLGKDMFTRLVGKAENDSKAKIREQILNPGADVVVLDEAHTQLKSATTEIGKALDTVETNMRICLSGSPFNNNLREYFRMSSWVRPGVLGREAEFEKYFVGPIMEGMPADATEAQVSSQVRKTQELSNITSAFMHRLDKGALAQSLSPLLEIVIHLRQTKLQRRLMRVFSEKSKELEQSGKKLSFFEHYQAMRPLSNHPACLLLRQSKEQAVLGQKATAAAIGVGASDGEKKLQPSTINVTEGTVVGVKLENSLLCAPSRGGNEDDVIEINTTDEEEDVFLGTAENGSGQGTAPNPQQSGEKKRRGSRRVLPIDWWAGVLEDRGEEAFMVEFAGYKIVMLLQIVAHADILGEKTVVFSQCLVTLRYIESVLQSKGWGQKLFGYRYLPDDRNERYSQWSKGKEYLAFDGSTHSQERGELIDKFNSSKACKVFLISIAAGGIGVNLTGATRVVVFDNHWNPTVSTQAISRCWRFGQTKPVYAYRFITEGSIEEKVFARLVNKSGLAARVIDQKYPERMFVGRELDQITEHDIWACCDLCGKWRMLIFENDQEKAAIDDDDSLWVCENNKDPSHNRCDIQEHDQSWYSRNMGRLRRKFEKAEGASQLLPENTACLDALDVQDVARTKQLIDEDEILRRLEIADIFTYRPEDAVKASPSKKRKKDGSPSKKKKKGSKSFARKVVSRVRFTQELLKGTKTDLEMEATHAKTRDQETAGAPSHEIESEVSTGVGREQVVSSTNHKNSAAIVAPDPAATQQSSSQRDSFPTASNEEHEQDALKEQPLMPPRDSIKADILSKTTAKRSYVVREDSPKASKANHEGDVPASLQAAHLLTQSTSRTNKKRKLSNLTNETSSRPTTAIQAQTSPTEVDRTRKGGRDSKTRRAVANKQGRPQTPTLAKLSGKTNDEAISLLSDSDSE